MKGGHFGAHKNISIKLVSNEFIVGNIMVQRKVVEQWDEHFEKCLQPETQTSQPGGRTGMHILDAYHNQKDEWLNQKDEWLIPNTKREVVFPGMGYCQHPLGH